MPQAVGVIETLGFPAVLAAADEMVKGGRVTLVYFDKAESGQFVVGIRGSFSEVRLAMEAGKEAAEASYGGNVVSHYIVPNPPENLLTVLPLDYTEEIKEFHV